MKGSYRTIGVIAAATVLSSLGYASTAAAHHQAPSDPPSQYQPNGCGQVATANLTLTHDVGPCPNNGIVVKGDNVTIDLNGHTVYGLTRNTDANEPDANEPCLTDPEAGPHNATLGAGVLNDGGYDNLTVKGRTVRGTGARGTIRCFSGGVEIRAFTDPVEVTVSVPNLNTVTDLNVKNNIGNVLSDWGEGIGAWGATNTTVTAATVDKNGPFAGIGLYDGSTDSIIGGAAADGNSVTGNNFPVQGGTTNQDDGIRVEPNSKRNIVTHNTVTGSGLDGIALFTGATDNQVNSNIVQGNGYHAATHRKGDGIRLFPGANANTLKSNTVGGSTATTPSEGNAANGIYVASDNNNIGVDGSGVLGGNTVAGNAYTVDATRGPLGGGIFLEGYLQRTTVVSADGNKVKANTVTNNSAHGIHVGGDNNEVGGSTTAQGNTATANAFSGILADAYTGAKAENNKIDGNSATGNNTSVGGWSDLHDLRADLDCGNVEGLPNLWGSLALNTYGTRNRVPPSNWCIQ